MSVVASSNPYAKFGRECANCHTLVGGLEKKLASMPDDQILSKMVQASVVIFLLQASAS